MCNIHPRAKSVQLLDARITILRDMLGE